MQWLFNAADNAFIQALGGFPRLEAHEALLENAYTPVKYRGLGIMSAAMALIAEHAAAIGATHVITFVDDNVASLKGCPRGVLCTCCHRAQMGFGLSSETTSEALQSDPRRTLKF
jgi:hypothetical protein